MFRKSPRRRGYHLKVYHSYAVNAAKSRRAYFDDKQRLLHDILNPDHINNVLWDKKVINRKKYFAGKWRVFDLKSVLRSKKRKKRIRA